MDLSNYYQEYATAMLETQAFESNSALREINDAMQMDGYFNAGANFIEYPDAFSYQVNQNNPPGMIDNQNSLGTYLESPYDYGYLMDPNHLIPYHQNEPYGLNNWEYTAAPGTMEPAIEGSFQDVQQANHESYPGNPTTSQPVLSEPAKSKARNNTPNSSKSFMDRREFGLLQIKMTESTLRIIRKHYDYIPRPVFQKHEPGAERSVRLTQREVENLRIHLARKGVKMKTYNRKTDFQKKGPTASAWYEETMAKGVAKATGRNVNEVLAEIRAHVI